MTCCPVGKHAQVDQIDRLIRAQQSASQAGQSTLAMSYSTIAKTYGVRKATLLAHRDVCMAQRTGTPEDSVPVRSDGVPGRIAGDTDDENLNDSARSSRYGATVPARGDEGVETRGGRATGPPGDGTDRRSVSQRRVPVAAQSGSDRVAQRDADVAAGVGQNRPGSASTVDESRSMGEGQVRPPERPRPDAVARARDPVAVERARKRWDTVGYNSVEVAAERITHAIADSELTDPNGPRAHATYVQEIVELIERDAWDGDVTATRLARTWDKPKMFVLGCYRDACTLMRIARGSPNEDREVSLRRWIKLFRAAMDKGDALSMKVAADALKGYDAAAGIVDKSTRVQVNIAQSDEAKLFVSIFLDEAKGDPVLLERIRRRLAEARDKLGDPTALLTTGAEVDAAE